MKLMQVSVLFFKSLNHIYYYAESSEELLDECVSCGTDAHVYCENCKSSPCEVCNDQWHKHPKRKNHKTRVCLYFPLAL